MSDRAEDAFTDLADRARGGDRGALEGLVDEAAAMVRRWALVHTRDRHDADDVMQEVLIQMIRKQDALPAGTALRRWLYVVTRNAATDRLRRRSRLARVTVDVDSLADMTAPAAAEPEPTVAGIELRALLGVFFNELPRRQREVFDLVELQGLPAVQAAELLGIRASSVRTNLFKARRRMRKRILAAWPEVREDRRQ